MSSKKLKQLAKEEATTLLKLDNIKNKIKEEQSKTLVKCTHNFFWGEGCGKSIQIGKLTYIQTHWYESPYGCTGGDEWHEGEGQFICPRCGRRNRLYDRPEIEKLKYQFRDIEDEYKER